jgi:PBP1b-binding outer membrane lipoprotein LpoB
MRIFGIILTAALILSSCEQAEDVFEDLLPEMYATIDGEKWTSLARTTTMQDGAINIIGVSLSKETIVLRINGNTTGTYSVPIEVVAAYNETEITDPYSLDNAFVGLTGSVTITEVNTTKKTISGTFNFNATRITDSKNVTEGKFVNIKYND